MNRRTSIVVVSAAVLLLGPLSTGALAHVAATTEEDPDPGTEVTLELSFNHGCAGDPTVELATQIPDDVEMATVEPIEEGGWSATVEERTVTWSGGDPIPDHVDHTFRLRLVLPATPGETIYLPTVQRCEGESYAWIQIPDEDQSWSDLDEPAPALTLTDRPAPEREEADETDDIEGTDPEPTPEPTPDAPEETPTDAEDEAFLTEDDSGLGFPIAVLAVLVALGVIGTVAVLVARRGDSDAPSA